MIQKTVNDYYDQLAAKYPTIPLKDIKRIVQYGWKAYYRHNDNGGDVLINQGDFWMYCGELMNDSFRYFNYYVRKMCVKLRIMYKRKEIPWDGYYYFALTPKQYEHYLAQKKKRGRPRKFFNFGTVILYKIYDECNIREHSKVALFRVPQTIGDTFTKYKPDFISNSAELIQVREPLKFKDVLLSNYDYQFISDNLRRYNKKNNG